MCLILFNHRWLDSQVVIIRNGFRQLDADPFSDESYRLHMTNTLVISWLSGDYAMHRCFIMERHRAFLDEGYRLCI